MTDHADLAAQPVTWRELREALDRGDTIAIRDTAGRRIGTIGQPIRHTPPPAWCLHADLVPVETIHTDAAHPCHTAPVITLTGHYCATCHQPIPLGGHP